MKAAVATVKSYHHYPVSLSRTRADVPKHLIRHVPRDIAHSAGTRVTPYHRRTRDVERGERGGIRCVGEVYKDPETIEFPDKCFAERTATKTLVPW
jgi:hypothetical protein